MNNNAFFFPTCVIYVLCRIFSRCLHKIERRATTMGSNNTRSLSSFHEPFRYLVKALIQNRRFLLDSSRSWGQDGRPKRAMRMWGAPLRALPAITYSGGAVKLLCLCFYILLRVLSHISSPPFTLHPHVISRCLLLLRSGRFRSPNTSVLFALIF